MTTAKGLEERLILLRQYKTWTRFRVALFFKQQTAEIRSSDLQLVIIIVVSG